jgi:hypothetical protein
VEELGKKYLEKILVVGEGLQGLRSRLPPKIGFPKHRVGSGCRCRDAPYGLRVRVPPFGLGLWREDCPDIVFALFIWLQMQLGFSFLVRPKFCEVTEVGRIRECFEKP